MHEVQRTQNAISDVKCDMPQLHRHIKFVERDAQNAEQEMLVDTGESCY